MVLLQYRVIHPRFIVIPFGKAQRNQFHQIVKSGLIFRKKYQMKIPRFPLLHAFLFHVFRKINFRPQNRMNSLLFGFLIKIDNAIHHAMIRKRTGIHAEFFDSGNHLRNLSRTVQQTIATVYM